MIELTVGLDFTYARSQRRQQPRTRLSLLMHEGVFCNRRARIHPGRTNAAVNARLISQHPLSPSNTKPFGTRRTLYDLDSTQLRRQPAARRPSSTTIMNIIHSTAWPNRTRTFELRFTSNEPTARFSWLPSAVASGFSPRCAKRNIFHTTRHRHPVLFIPSILSIHVNNILLSPASSAVNPITGLSKSGIRRTLFYST
jgi:hypothetical protein